MSGKVDMRTYLYENKVNYVGKLINSNEWSDEICECLFIR